MAENPASMPAGYRLVELDDVDSTNAEAGRLLDAGECGPLWVRANAQLAGRGRKGRHWVSRPGNLYATLLMMPDAPVACMAQLGFVACLAIYDMAARLLGSDAGLTLKWPNDVLLDGRKLSGILTESLLIKGSQRYAAALGCGVNLAHAPGDTRYGATCLADHGRSATPAEALHHLAHAFEHWRSVWSDGAGFDQVRQAWTDRSVPLGAAMVLDLAEECVEGRFAGLARDGALMLDLADGTQKQIRAGDVLHAHPTAG
ncbi:MAG: biotin--[acetyl-CoA-carboxylase] ligase [Aestuariivirgaceae bacterium]